MEADGGSQSPSFHGLTNSLWGVVTSYLDLACLHNINCACRHWDNPNDTQWMVLWIRYFDQLPTLDPMQWGSTWRREVMLRSRCGVHVGHLSDAFLRSVCVMLSRSARNRDVGRDGGGGGGSSSSSTSSSGAFVALSSREYEVGEGGRSNLRWATPTDLKRMALNGPSVRLVIPICVTPPERVVGQETDSAELVGQKYEFLSPKGYFDVELLASCMLRAAHLSLESLNHGSLPLIARLCIRARRAEVGSQVVVVTWAADEGGALEAPLLPPSALAPPGGGGWGGGGGARAGRGEGGEGGAGGRVPPSPHLEEAKLPSPDPSIPAFSPQPSFTNDYSDPSSMPPFPGPPPPPP